MGGTGRSLGKTFLLHCQRRHPEFPKIPTYLPFLELDHGGLRANWSAPISFVPESSGSSLASQLVLSKQQVNLVREKGDSIFE